MSAVNPVVARSTPAPSSVVAPKNAQTTSALTPDQQRALFVTKKIEDTANLIIGNINEVMAQDCLEVENIKLSGKPRPADATQCAFPKNTTKNECYVYYMRVKKIIEEHSLKNLESETKKLTSEQKTFYDAVLSKCATKISENPEHFLLSIHMWNCQNDINNAGRYDFSKSLVLKSKVLATVLKAPSKFLALFK